MKYIHVFSGAIYLNNGKEYVVEKFDTKNHNIFVKHVTLKKINIPYAHLMRKNCT